MFFITNKRVIKMKFDIVIVTMYYDKTVAYKNNPMQYGNMYNNYSFHYNTKSRSYHVAW